MASMYGGQGANAAAKGFQQGYKFQQDSEAAMQEAEIRSEKIKKSRMNNELMDMAVDDVRLKQQKEIDTLKQTQTKTNSTLVKQDLNNMVVQNNTADKQAQINTVKSNMKSNPDIYKALGIKNPDTMVILNTEDNKDREWMENTLLKQGVKRDDYGDTWDEVVTDVMKAYPALKADGAIVDLNGLAVSMGASSMGTPQYNKIVEANRKSIADMLTKAEAKSMSGTDFKADKLAADAEVPMANISDTPDAEVPMANTSDTPAVEPASTVEAVKQDIKATETAVTNAKGDIKSYMKFEGFRAKPYKDGDGYAIGYGHAIKPGEEHLMNGVTEEQAQNILKEDIARHTAGLLKNDPWIAKQPENVQVALKDMAFNMGPAFLDKFPSLRKALQEGDTAKAGEIIRGSKYASQVHGRAQRNASLIDGSKYEGSSSGSAVASQVRDTITTTAGPTGLDDMRMRKIYALLGRTYPKDPNESTAKMKNYEFLRGLVGDEAAYDGVFGKTNSNVRLSTIGKLKREQSAYAPGSKDYKDYEDRIDKLNNMQSSSFLSKNEATRVLNDPASSLEERQAAQSYLDTAHKKNIETDKNLSETASLEANGLIRKLDDKGTPPEIREKTIAKLKGKQTELRKADPNSHKVEKPIIEEMMGNQVSMNQMTDILNRVDGGDLKKVQKGAIDGIKTAITKGLDEPTRKAMKDVKGFNESTVASIKLDTALGLLQASFIKAISGATVTDKEREILVNTMVGSGNGWTSVRTLKLALNEFRKQTVEKMAKQGKQLQQGTSPHDGYVYSTVDQLNSEKATAKGLPTRDEWVERYGNSDKYDAFIESKGGI